MTPSLYYWSFAFFLTLTTVVIGFRGLALIKRGEISRHRNHMNWACGLMVFFVFTYLFKVLFLGREDKSDWSQFHLVVLYIHESFIFLMLGTGSYTRYLAHKFKGSLDAENIPEEDARRRKRHKFIGKLALVFAVSALFTASVVLYGMFRRAGF